MMLERDQFYIVKSNVRIEGVYTSTLMEIERT